MTKWRTAYHSSQGSGGPLHVWEGRGANTSALLPTKMYSAPLSAIQTAITKQAPDPHAAAMSNTYPSGRREEPCVSSTDTLPYSPSQ